MANEPSECKRHNDIVVYQWRGKFRLIRICIYCNGMIKYPKTYWTRTAMDIAARDVKADVRLLNNEDEHS